MPASGPVYQPTTVSYEQQNEWSRPGVTYLRLWATVFAIRGASSGFSLGLGIFTFTAGLIMVIEGTVNLSDQTQIPVESGEESENKDSSTSGLVITIVGALLILIGILLLSVYVRLVRRRKGCPCFPSKEERLARQLDNQASNGQILTLNPSTDLLVTAQYGPVSEIAYQPPAASEQEETHKLMASDNKECNEESERMLESDPRIVLRPLSHNEEA